MSSFPQGRVREISTGMMLVGLLYLALHLALLIHDVRQPEAWLQGDRAEGRIELVIAAAQADAATLSGMFLDKGLPGDYLIHSLLFAAGGKWGVILFQCLLGLLNLWLVMRLARELGTTPGTAALAGVLFAVLPGSMMNPHLLVTESYFTAAFSAGVWAWVRAARVGGWMPVLLGCLLFTAAATVRPQAMPYALVAALLLPVSRCLFDGQRFSVTPLALALAGLLVFPGSWILWRYLMTGDIGLGASEFDLATNLQIRVDRAQAILGTETWGRYAAEGPGRLELAGFLQFSAEHPVAVLRTFLSDLLNFVANPGANAVFGYYLQWFETPDVFYWKHLLDQKGVLGLLQSMASQNAAFIACFAWAGMVHATVLGGALIGAVSGLMQPLLRSRMLLLLALLLMQAGVVFASGLVRWAHRAPLEPLLAVLAAIGLQQIFLWLQTRRQRPAVYP